MRSADVLPLKIDEAQPAEPSLRGPEPGATLEPAPVRTRAVRLANVERLRLLAMFEIVAFHVSGAFVEEGERLPVIAGLGLPTFLLLNNAFNCTLAERMGTSAFMRVKVSRLVLPWLVWSVFYAGTLVLERLRHGEPLGDGFSIWMIVGGTYDHLWFVPFALCGSVLVAGLQARSREWSAVGVVASALAAGLCVVVACAVTLLTQPIEWPALQWLFALPSPLLGFALGRAVLAPDGKLLRRIALLMTPLALGVVAFAYFEPQIEMLRRYMVSLALVSLAFVWPGNSDRFSQRLTPLLFGVYLVHPFFVRVYQALHLPRIPLVILTVMVFGLAVGVVLLLGRTRLRRLV